MWQIPVLPLWKSGKAAAAKSMKESVTEEEQQRVQGDELIGGSAVVKASATPDQADWETWHRRPVHVAVSTLEVMHKEKCVHGLQLQGDGAHYGSYEACMQNKFAQFPFPRKKPSTDMLWVWGCMGLVMVPKEQRHKLEVAAVWAVHLGMAPDSKGWLMQDPKSKKTLQVSGPAAEEGLEDESARMDSPSQPEPAATAKVTKRLVQKGASPHGQQTATREKRVAAPPSRLKYSCLGGPKQGAMSVQADEIEDEEMAFCFFTSLLGEPATVEEALSGPQKEEWKAAMDAEFNSLIENGT
ncbi:unnamed protein product [Closterium sp. NIES-54]